MIFLKQCDIIWDKAEKKGNEGLSYTDLIFVFGFLPVCVIAGWCCREISSRNLVTAVCSLVFICWGRSVRYALVLVPAIVTYICGRTAKKAPAVSEAIGDAVLLASATAGIFALGEPLSLTSALWSAGFLMSALRGMSYLRLCAGGMEPEKSPLNLTVYLIAFENMLISPIVSYRDARENIAQRSITLSKVSKGLPMFIKGFALTAVCGLGFDAVRTASFEYAAFPWMNAVILCVATFFEALVVTSGYLDMSCGLSMMTGMPYKREWGAVMPSRSLKKTVSGFSEGFADTVIKTFCERSRTVYFVFLGCAAVLGGVFSAYKMPAPALVCISAAALILSARSDGKYPKADAVFTIIILAAAIILPGIMQHPAFFEGFGSQKYDYDITYILNYEFLRRMPWMIIGIAAVSPLKVYAGRFIKQKVSSGGKSYALYKYAETAICAVLLILGAAAALKS